MVSMLLMGAPCRRAFRLILSPCGGAGGGHRTPLRLPRQRLIYM